MDRILVTAILPGGREQPLTLPAQGRVLGVDHGLARVGLALADLQYRIASPLETYLRRTPKLDEQYFRQLAEQERLRLIVVGFPLSTGGGENPQARICRQFAETLLAATGVPTVLHDERFTSAFADQALREAGVKAAKRKGTRDRIAAQMILTAFLESHPATPE